MAESNQQAQKKSIILCVSKADMAIMEQTSLDMKEIRRQSDEFTNTKLSVFFKDYKLSYKMGNNKNVHQINKSNEIEIINQQLKVKCDEYNELQKKFDIISNENNKYKQQIEEIKKILSNP